MPIANPYSSRVETLSRRIRQGRRILVTVEGLACIEPDDCFDDRVIDLHWRSIIRFLIDDTSDDLREFRGFTIHGHSLAASPQEIGACLRFVES